MQNLKKLSARILSLVLTAALVGTMLPATAFAAEVAAPADGVTLPASPVMAEKQTKAAIVTRTTPLDLTANADITYIAADGTTPKTANPTTASITDTGEGWSWDYYYKTLTLSGATIDCSGNAAVAANTFGIKMPSNAKITLSEGTTSRVTGGKVVAEVYPKWNDTFGIYLKDGLTVSGSGTLYTTGGIPGNPNITEKNCRSYGISSEMTGDINIIDGAVVHAAGGVFTAGTAISDGILANGDLKIKNNAVVYATGGDVRGVDMENGKESYISTGIIANRITLEDKAIVNAKGRLKAMEGTSGITAVGATVTGAKEGFTSGTTKVLTQSGADPVKISMIKSVTFDPRNGDHIADAVIDNTTKKITLPNPAPTWSDYAFAGWYTGIDGAGTAVTADTVLDANTKVYAKWTKGVNTVRTTPLDLSMNDNVTYIDAGGVSKTANPFAVNITDTGEGWSWDLSTKTLTLSGATIDCSGNATVDTNVFGIKSYTSDYNILLTDGTTNTVKAGTTSAQKSYGVWLESETPPKISGKGTLHATGGGATSDSSGIYNHRSTLTVSDATIIATAGTSSPAGHGIYSRDYLELQSGTITATGTGTGHGMHVQLITMSGGTVTAVGGTTG